MNFGSPGQMKIEGLEDVFSQPEKPVYVLNAGQQAAFDWMVPFCLMQVPNVRRALLEGYAGTGKTFVLNRIVEEVVRQHPGLNFGMTAPTHKAVRQLRKHSDMKNMFDFGTIHSFLGLKQVKDEWTGEVTYKAEWNANGRRIDGIDVLIVDEVSMLDDDLDEHIEDELRSNSKLVVIYTGDPLQIPPVGKKKRTGIALSRPFLESIQKLRGIHRMVLTEPQRQAADSPIILYAHTIRDQQKRQAITFDFKEEYKHALELLPPKGNKAKVLDLFRQYFDTEQFREDTDYAKVIAWRNKTVDAFNTEIRKIIYKKDVLPKILEGEEMVMDAPVVKNDKVVIANNEEVQIMNLKESTFEWRYKLPKGQYFEGTDIADPLADVSAEGFMIVFNVYQCDIVTPDDVKQHVRVVHESSDADYHNLREQIKKAAKDSSDTYVRRDMWKQFYALEEKFAWMKYNYCITGHKSQGSTYEYCISMEWDINENFDIEERNRIRYVAASRAKHKLIVIK